MKWYLAKLVFAIKIGKKKRISEFDEQLRLVCARHENEAFLKARLMGVREEEKSTNKSDNNVVWLFVDVASLAAIELKDGEEVSSCVREHDDADSYISYVRIQANRIEQKTEKNAIAVE